MIIVRGLVLVLFAAISLVGQTGAQPGSISGRVVNGLTGDLLPGATVRLMPLRARADLGSQPSTSSQSDGSFRFDSLAPGNYLVLGEREGFTANRPANRALFVSVAPGQYVTDIQVALLPNGSISGKVLDQNGKPLVGIRVEALSSLPKSGQPSFRRASEATTDQSGAFTLHKLPPGNYYALALPDPKTKPDETGYELVYTFYPRYQSLSEATALPVAAGQAASGADITMRPVLTHHIRGKLSQLPDGASNKTVRLTITPNGDADATILNRSADVNPDLTFDIAGLVPGRYTLRLTGAGPNRRNPRQLAARQDIELGNSDISGFVLTPSLPITLTGVVTVDASTQIALTNVNVFARPLEDAANGRMSFGRVSTDGTFSLQGLEPGMYTIQVQANQPGLYVSSLTLNQQDIRDRQVDISQSGGGQVAIVLRPGAGEIDIALQNSDSQAMAILVPEGLAPDGSNVRMAYPTPGKPAIVKNLPPGNYLGYAIDNSDPSPWTNPGFLREIVSLGTSVHLDENGRQLLQLQKLSADLFQDAAARVGISYP